jgi:hypothetical protein
MYAWVGPSKPVVVPTYAKPRLEAEPSESEYFDVLRLKPNPNRVRAPSSDSWDGFPEPVSPKSEPSSSEHNGFGGNGPISEAESEEASRRGREGGRGVALTLLCNLLWRRGQQVLHKWRRRVRMRADNLNSTYIYVQMRLPARYTRMYILSG